MNTKTKVIVLKIPVKYANMEYSAYRFYVKEQSSCSVMLLENILTSIYNTPSKRFHQVYLPAGTICRLMAYPEVYDLDIEILRSAFDYVLYIDDFTMYTTNSSYTKFIEGNFDLSEFLKED